MMKKISYIIIILAIIFLVWYAIARDGGSNGDDANGSGNTDRDEATLSLTIDDEQGKEGVAVLDEVMFLEGDALADILLDLDEQAKIELVYQDYGGDLGLFIEQINGVGDDGSGAWWQYWVNGDYATVGVSSYEPEDGDVILFKYTEEQELLE